MAKHFAMDVKGNYTRFLEREIRMVLVGKTGVGKSDTGNTICGDGEIFEVMASAASVTKKCKQHCFTRFGLDLQLVDVPGFCDTSRSHEDIKNEVAKCVGMSSPGIHAILFIVRIGRLGKEDKETLERFLQCFGKEAKQFVIVVFTGKDDLKAGRDTIDSFVHGCPAEMRTFISDISLRFLAVNNHGTVEEKERFSKGLIDMVQNMVDENGGQCYTNKMYERCERDLQEAEKKEKLEENRQKHLDKVLKELLRQKEEVEQQLTQERTPWEENKEETLLERIRVVKLRQMEGKERKRPEIEKNDFLRKQMEREFERKKEELFLEEMRKQIRQQIERGNMGFIRTTLYAMKDIVGSLW